MFDKEKILTLQMERRYGKSTTRTVTIYQVQQLYWQYLTAAFHANHYTRAWYARTAHDLAFKAHWMRKNREFETETSLPELTKNQMHFWKS